jgi:tetratricopeptide (TPR) repeat protein
MWRVLLFLATTVATTSGSRGQSRMADSLMSALKSHPTPDTVQVTILNELAFENHFSSPVQSLEFSNLARQLANDLQFQKGIALSYRHQGLALWTQALYADALEAFYKGLNIADSLGYITIKADITGNIGLVQNGLGNYIEALKSFRESYSLHQALKNTKRMVIMMNNIGDCYLYLHQPEEALKAYNKSLEMGKPISLLEETNHRNIGNVYETLGSFVEAEKHYIESKGIGDQLKEGREMTLIRKSLASLYLKKGDLSQAEKYAKEAITIAIKGNYRAPLRDEYFLLSRILDAKGDAKESFRYYKLGSAYKDSIQNFTETSRVAAFQRNFELQLKQKQIDSLQKDAELKEKELSISRILTVSAVVGVLLLALYVYNIIRGYRFQKAVAALLKDRHGEISRQNNQLHEQQAELKRLNEVIVQQAEEVKAQRDQLADKTKQIELLNIELSSLNYYLEKKVEERTNKLEIQNRALTEYAFFNAHKLRGPIARILGIMNILDIKHIANDNDELLIYLRKASIELDEITRSMGAQLDSGVTAFENSQEDGDTKPNLTNSNFLLSARQNGRGTDGMVHQ